MRKLAGAGVLALMAAACGGEERALKRAVEAAPIYDYDVTRDEWGVATSSGVTDADAAYGFAVAHAQDDFANIQSVVFAAKGMAGRLAGKDGAISDYFHALTDVEGTLARYDEDVPEEFKAVLQGYADGLNAYALANPKERKPGPWPVTGRDVAGGFVLTSPLFYGLDDEIGQLVEGYYDPCAAPVTREAMADAQPKGSNGFAVSPKGSDDGSTMLIVNSHQPYDGPLAWYEARIESGEGWALGGGTFAGAPFPLIGYNPDFAFAATVNRPDLVDHYRLVVDEAHKDQYYFDGEWRDFEDKRVTLKVKFGPLTLPVRRTIRYSVHGPVFKTPAGPVAIAYAKGTVRAAEQFYRLGKSRSVDEFLEAMTLRGFASFNYIVADRTGKIGFFYNAALPRRPESWDGKGCAPGDDPAMLWDGLRSTSENPQVIDPPSGWVYSANSTPFSATHPDDDLDPADFPANIGVEPTTTRTNRSLRAVELLSAAAPISPEELEAVKFDITYSENHGMRAAVARIIEEAKTDPELEEIAAVLTDYDFTGGKESRGAILAMTTYTPFGTADHYGYPRPDFVPTVKNRAQRVREIFGRLDPTLEEAVRHRRGDVDVAIEGGPDLLRALRWEITGDTLRANFGDGFMAFIEWEADGTQKVRTIHQYGAAVGRPDNPHYDDQAELYAAEGWKSVPPPAPRNR